MLNDACSRSVSKYCDDINHGRGRGKFSVMYIFDYLHRILNTVLLEIQG